MDNLWYIHTMEYYLVRKKNELSGQKMTKKKNHNTNKTWSNLKCILPSQRSQSEKAMSYLIPAI